MELILTPLHADPRELGRENGLRVWEASTDDPSFIARPTTGGALGAGWHSATAMLEGRSGDIRDPTLYLPDPAGHFSEERSVRMVRDGAAYTAEFYLPQPVDHVRFDPSRSRCEFACETLRVASIEAPKRPPATGVAAMRLPGAARLRGWWRAGVHRLADGARTHVAAARTGNRKARVLATIDRGGPGIEIGPSHDPIAPKREGFDVHVIDHATREELQAKYAKHGLALDRIEEVDFVWKGQSYLELTGRPRHYSWIIASHLIEHTPDLIAFLEDCDSILKDGGVLSLVIPDKRFCFDRFRPITGLARVVDAHLAGNRIHSAGTVAEYFMNVASKDKRLAWDAGTNGEYTFIHFAHQAKDRIREVQEKGSYLDVHNWCFVPHSFRLLLADLHTLGYTKLREVEFHAHGEYEFYVTLGRHGTGPHLSRLEILREIDAELAATDAAAS